MKIGFTENEAKAYIGLVKLNEAGARELHEYSGIPRAKIYEVLSGLVEKGYAQVRHGSPTYYGPAEPEELITKLKKEYMEIFRTISENMENLHCERDESSPIWYLKSEWPIMKRGRSLILETKKDLIIVSNDPTCLSLFKDEIRKISKKAEVIIFAEDIASYSDFGASVFKKEMEYQKFFRSIIEKEIEDGQYASDFIDRKKVMLISDASTALIIENKAGKTEGIYLTDQLVRIIYHSIIFMHKNMENLSDEGDTIKIVIRKPKKENGKKNVETAPDTGTDS